MEPGLGRPLPPEVKVEEPKEELEASASGEAGFVLEAVKAEPFEPKVDPEVPPAEGVPARLSAVVMETAAQVGSLTASTTPSTEIAQPQKGRKPRDLELPLSPSLLGGPGPERTPGSGTGSGLQAPGPALTPSLLPTHTLVRTFKGAGPAPGTNGIGARWGREELDLPTRLPLKEWEGGAFEWDCLRGGTGLIATGRRSLQCKGSGAQRRAVLGSFVGRDRKAFCRNCFWVEAWLEEPEWGFGVWDFLSGFPVRYAGRG